MASAYPYRFGGKSSSIRKEVNMSEANNYALIDIQG